MANYGFKGLRLETADDIRRALSTVSEYASEPIERLSVHLYTPSLEDLTRIVQQTSLTDLRVFCWSRHAFTDDNFNHLLDAATTAEFKWRSSRLSFQAHFPPVWYDWDGAFSGMHTIRYAESFPSPVLLENRIASHQVQVRLRNAIRQLTSPGAAEYRDAMSMSDDETTHSYFATIPTGIVQGAARSLLNEFDASALVCSWELSGSTDQLTSLIKTSQVNLKDYPPGCFHRGLRSKEFGAAVRSDWIKPVLNCGVDDAIRVSEAILTSRIPCNGSISRTFLSWRLPEGTYGPKTAGNHVLLSFCGKTPKLFVGAEQWVETDPPVRSVSPDFREIAARLGAELKPNNYFV